MDARRQIQTLVEDLTSTGEKTLDVQRMKDLKSILKISDANVQVAWKGLLERLSAKTCQVRYLALLICGDLFERSKAFRGFVAQDFREFTELTVGARLGSPLPPPEPFTSDTRARALELIESWNEKYGTSLKQIGLGYKYLRDTLKVKFPDVRAREAARQRQEDAERSRNMRILETRFCKQFAKEFSDLKNSVEESLSAMGLYFDILVPDTMGLSKQSHSTLQTRTDDVGAQEDDDDEQWETVAGGENTKFPQENLFFERVGGASSSSFSDGALGYDDIDLQCALEREREEEGVMTMMEGGIQPVEIVLAEPSAYLAQRTEENAVIFEALTEHTRLLHNHKIPLLEELLSFLDSLAPSTAIDHTQRERRQVEVLHLKQRTEIALSKSSDLGVSVKPPETSVGDHDQSGGGSGSGDQEIKEGKEGKQPAQEFEQEFSLAKARLRNPEFVAKHTRADGSADILKMAEEIIRRRIAVQQKLVSRKKRKSEEQQKEGPSPPTEKDSKARKKKVRADHKPQVPESRFDKLERDLRRLS